MSREHRQFCQARRCDQHVPRGRLMCKHHWFLAPRHLRDDVTNTWEQWKKTRHPDDMQRYREAVGKAVASIAPAT